METTARIVLTRSAEWMNRMRNYRVIIDGQKAGVIGNGATEEFRVAPGEHKVICKVDWCSSREFDVRIDNGETAYLHVSSGMKHYWYFVFPLFVVLAMNFYYVFSEGGRPMWFNYVLIVAALPTLLYVFYFLTIGRRDYLLLVRDDKTLFGK